MCVRVCVCVCVPVCARAGAPGLKLVSYKGPADARERVFMQQVDAPPHSHSPMHILHPFSPRRDAQTRIRAYLNTWTRLQHAPISSIARPPAVHLLTWRAPACSPMRVPLHPNPTPDAWRQSGQQLPRGSHVLRFSDEQDGPAAPGSHPLGARVQSERPCRSCVHGMG